MECLKMEPLWWHGPEWFQNTDFAHDIPEEKVNIDEVNQYLLVAQEDKVDPQSNPENVISPLDKHDRLITSLRITAWIKRFVFNTRNKVRRNGPLTADEIDMAECHWIKATQQKCFSQEIKELQSGMEVHRKSKIKDLNPSLDDKGMLRVGKSQISAIDKSTPSYCPNRTSLQNYK